MVNFGATLPAATVALALSSSVSGAYTSDQELEARNPTIARLAGQAARTTLRTTMRQPASRIASQIAHQAPMRAQAVTGKQLTMGLVGGKLAAGAIVGFGALGAQTADEKFINKREYYEYEELYARNPVLRTGARLAVNAGRTIARPNIAASVARPALRTPIQQPSTMMPKLRGAATIIGIGTAAGVGEYYGGKHMGNANERLENHNKRELLADALEELLARHFSEPEEEVSSRDLYGEDDFLARDLEDDELWTRNPILRGATRAASGALRAAGRTTVQQASHIQPASVGHRLAQGTKMLAKGAGIGAAAGAGGYVEGGIQNLTPDTAQKIKADPKNTITNMLPSSNLFGHNKRDLVGNDLEIRALLDMIVDELD